MTIHRERLEFPEPVKAKIKIKRDRKPAPLTAANFILLRLVAQSCPTLGYPMDSSPIGNSIRGIFQARILEWIAIFFSRGSS